MFPPVPHPVMFLPVYFSLPLLVVASYPLRAAFSPCVYGGCIGGVCGTLGAVCAAAFGWFCGDVDAVGATVSFVSSLFG